MLRVYVPIVYVDDHLRVLIAGQAWPADCDAVEHMFGDYIGLHSRPDAAQPVWAEFL